MFQIPSSPAGVARYSDHDLESLPAGGCGKELKPVIFRTDGGVSAAVTAVSHTPLTVPYVRVTPSFAARFRCSRLHDPRPEGNG
jgi:hypothetical protein